MSQDITYLVNVVELPELQEGRQEGLWVWQVQEQGEQLGL